MNMKRTKRVLAFDAAKEAESLYFTLLKRGEYTSAATILNRLMGSSTPEAAPTDDDKWVAWLTADEGNDLDQHLAALDQLRASATARRDAGAAKPQAFLVELVDGSKVYRDHPLTADEEAANRAASKQRYLDSRPAADAPAPPAPIEEPDDELGPNEVEVGPLDEVEDDE
jgi:hypothetical protein